MSTSRVESLTAFAADVAELLRLEGDLPVGRDADLYADWGLDSLQAFELIVILESMAGVDVPPPELPELFTLGDAFGYYRTLVGLPADAGA